MYVPLDEDWTNLAFSYKDGVQKVYINGELNQTFNSGAIFDDRYWNVLLGKNFNGEIDDLLMWNRSLSDAEIEFIYKSNLEKLNESSWSFTTSFSDLAEATYRYGVYVNDGFGWVRSLRRLIVDFPDEVRRSGGSGSISVEFKEGSVTRRLPRHFLIKMKKGEIDYSFKILEVEEEKVSLNFSRGVLDINLNESGKVDLDGDGFYDVEIFYSGSKGYFADLTITEIHEEIPSVREEVKVDEEVDEEIEEERKGFFRRIWDWFLGLFRRN